MSTIDQRVARGVELLDERFTGWRERVDADLLDVRSLHRCPLAQADGRSFAWAWDAIERPGWGNGTKHGFNWHPGLSPWSAQIYAWRLNRRWRRALRGSRSTREG
jgi:hypothetical protein